MTNELIPVEAVAAAPTCPRCETVELHWHEGWGYRCPACYLFVALPKAGS